METNRAAIERRLKAIGEAADKAYADFGRGHISGDQFNDVMARCERDLSAVKSARRTRSKAMSYSAGADSAEFTRANGGAMSGQFSGVKQRNLSPLDIDGGELRNMFEAAGRKMPYRAEITTKAFNVGGAGAPPVGTKAAGAPIAEGAPYPSGLFPPVIQPQLTQELPYEYDRFADHIPTIEIEAPSIEYLVHTGNTNPAAVP